MRLTPASQLEASLQAARTSGYKITASALLTLEAFSKKWLLADRLEPRITQATHPPVN